MGRLPAASLQGAGVVRPKLKSIVAAVMAADRGDEVYGILHRTCKGGQQRSHVLLCDIPEVFLQCTRAVKEASPIIATLCRA